MQAQDHLHVRDVIQCWAGNDIGACLGRKLDGTEGVAICHCDVTKIGEDGSARKFQLRFREKIRGATDV